MKLTLDALGKESVMYVGGEMALPPDYDFLALNGLRASCRTTRPRGSCSRSTARPRRAPASRPRCSRRRRS